jgi:hypothetical protein
LPPFVVENEFAHVILPPTVFEDEYEQANEKCPELVIEDLGAHLDAPYTNILV